MNPKPRTPASTGIRLLAVAVCAILWTAPPYLGQTALAPVVKDGRSSWDELSHAQQENVWALALDASQRGGPWAEETLRDQFGDDWASLIPHAYERLNASLPRLGGAVPANLDAAAARHASLEAALELIAGQADEAAPSVAAGVAAQETWSELLAAATLLGVNPLFQDHVLDWFNVTTPEPPTVSPSTSSSDGSGGVSGFECPRDLRWGTVPLCESQGMQDAFGILLTVLLAVLLLVLLPLVVVLFVVGVVGQLDADGDGLGDEWAEQWATTANRTIQAGDDLDGDGLTNLVEFRWELVPICVNVPTQDPPLANYTGPVVRIKNCLDFERDPGPEPVAKFASRKPRVCSVRIDCITSTHG